MSHTMSPDRSSRRVGVATVVLVAALVVVLPACSDDSTSTSSGAGSTSTAVTSSTTTVPGLPSVPLVFNGDGNNLDAYALGPDGAGAFPTQRVDTTIEDDPNGRDINGQICFFPDGSGHFIAGEDTHQPDPPQGWGIFQLQGSELGNMSVEQQGKLTPTYQPTADNAENYGCGFLSDGRLMITDVGNQAEGNGDGQLTIWFPPFNSYDVKYCKLDVTLATGQSILVGKDDAVYVATARGGVFRFTGPFPTGPDAAGGCDSTDATGAPMASKVNKSVFIASGANDLATPAGLAPAPDGGLYVSSVFNGVINEYGADGTFRRNILKPPAGESLGDKPYSTGTPLGIGTSQDGTLYYADIGIVVPPGKTPGPGDHTGSVRRLRFVDGTPQPPETMASGLDFPDGIGIYVPRA